LFSAVLSGGFALFCAAAIGIAENVDGDRGSLQRTCLAFAALAVGGVIAVACRRWAIAALILVTQAAMAMSILQGSYLTFVALAFLSPGVAAVVLTKQSA
jgi:hypothetical protein